MLLGNSSFYSFLRKTIVEVEVWCQIFQVFSIPLLGFIVTTISHIFILKFTFKLEIRRLRSSPLKKKPLWIVKKLWYIIQWIFLHTLKWHLLSLYNNYRGYLKDLFYHNWKMMKSKKVCLKISWWKALLQESKVQSFSATWILHDCINSWLMKY